MDTINPSGKISPHILEKTGILPKTEDREPQGGQPGAPRPKGQAPKRNRQEEKETGEKSGLDILV